METIVTPSRDLARERTSAPPASRLFRPEVIEYHAARRQWGALIELRPLPHRSLSWFAVLAAGTAVAFLSVAEYARKETVAGYVRPTLPPAKVFAPQAGVVRNVRVREGEAVRKGQPLMTVETPQVSVGGRDVAQASLDALRAQRIDIAAQTRAEEERFASERRRLSRTLEGLTKEVDALYQEGKRQDERVAIGRALVQSAGQLSARGVMADAEYKRRQQDQIDQERARDGITQRLAQRLNQLVDIQATLDQLPTINNARVQALRNDLAWVDRTIVETEARQGYVVVAPVSGTVTTMQAASGQPADPRQLQMTIVPEGDSLGAELLLPGRAAGFVEPGQRVRLLYEAYPYQKFGAYWGRVARVSATTVAPGEAIGPLVPTVNSYRVEVTLDSPDVMVDGRPVQLRPDMPLRADIMLERRTVLRWLVDPLLSAGNAVDADPLVRFWRETGLPTTARLAQAAREGARRVAGLVAGTFVRARDAGAQAWAAANAARRARPEPDRD